MLYFIRHAQTKFNVVRKKIKQKYSNSDYHLEQQWLAQRFNLQYVDSQITQEGIKQAQKCRQQLKNQNIDIVLVSPLRRTMQTCDIIFKNHKNKPKIIVDPHLRQYLESTCDIGGLMIQSMKQFNYFDFSLIKQDPQVWYIHNIFDMEVKQKILKKLEGLAGQQRRKRGIQLTLQFLKQWHVKVVDDREVLNLMYKPMKKQLDYIRDNYLVEERIIQGKNIAIVSHSQNLKTYFNRMFANCQVMRIPVNQVVKNREQNK